MPDLFKGFKRELRQLRKYIEDAEEFSFDMVLNHLDRNDFYQKIIIFRLEEEGKKHSPSKEELLRFLSLWEIELGETEQ